MADRCASVIRRLRPAPGRSPSPPMPLGVEPVQSAAQRVLMAADPRRDPRDSQPVPAERRDPGPLDPVRRGMPGLASRRIFLLSPSSSGGCALKNFGTQLASLDKTPALRGSHKSKGDRKRNQIRIAKVTAVLGDPPYGCLMS
jgi:hypothetical protein